MFTCLECKKNLPNKKSKRSLKKDTYSSPGRIRPPKYMLNPLDYKKFGY